MLLFTDNSELSELENHCNWIIESQRDPDQIRLGHKKIAKCKPYFVDYIYMSFCLYFCGWILFSSFFLFCIWFETSHLHSFCMSWCLVLRFDHIFDFKLFLLFYHGQVSIDSHMKPTGLGESLL